MLPRHHYITEPPGVHPYISKLFRVASLPAPRARLLLCQTKAAADFRKPTKTDESVPRHSRFAPTSVARAVICPCGDPRKNGKFPFDDARKPDERAYVIEVNRSEAFPYVRNFKARMTEFPRAMTRYSSGKGSSSCQGAVPSIRGRSRHPPVL